MVKAAGWEVGRERLSLMEPLCMAVCASLNLRGGEVGGSPEKKRCPNSRDVVGSEANV